MSLLRPIHHTFAPLGDPLLRREAMRLLRSPSVYRSQEGTEKLRKELSLAFGAPTFLFSSGRESLLALLRALTFALGDEIIVQGYTCVVVPNAIMAAGLTPIYCDIEKDTLNIDPGEAEKLITPRTRAIICQHTFGIPAAISALRELCDRHSLLLIEDCAHVLPDAVGPREIGRQGDALLLSFGRDKAICGITGGAVIVRNHELAPALFALEESATKLPRSIVMRLLLYPLMYRLARPFYGLWIGKAFLRVCKSLSLLVPIVTKEEKEGKQSPELHRIPNACAWLALSQWKRLHELNARRRILTQFYLEASRKFGWSVLASIHGELPLQKFPMFIKKAERLRRRLHRNNIHLHDGWTGCVVCPVDIHIDEVKYRSGEDPQAEEACEEILSLPTHPTMTLRQAEELVTVLQETLIKHPHSSSR